jgi:hypothetical protein
MVIPRWLRALILLCGMGLAVALPLGLRVAMEGLRSFGKLSPGQAPEKNWLPFAVLILYGALCLVPFAIVVWKDFTTDAEDEPETSPRIRVLVAAALVMSAPLLLKVVPSDLGMLVWLFQMVSLLGTAWLIAPMQCRRWFVVASLLGTPVILRTLY